jgi:hypothetical protein
MGEKVKMAKTRVAMPPQHPKNCCHETVMMGLKIFRGLLFLRKRPGSIWNLGVCIL